MESIVLTIQELLAKTAAFLKQRGLPTPRVDAEVMLSDMLGLKRIELYMYAGRPLEDDEVDRFRVRVERRGNHEPVAYINGTCGFWTLDLMIDARALIPRPETEHIVDLVTAFASQDIDRAWRIVDVGTGSGALALSIASELPHATVLAIDISSDALELARENAERLKLRERVKFVHGDLLRPLVSKTGEVKTVDIIVSNPPYVAIDDETGVGVREFEPDGALFSGRDGLDAIRRLIPQAAASLTSDGAFFCEFGSTQGPAVRELANGAFSEVNIVKDYAGHDRVLAASSPRKVR